MRNNHPQVAGFDVEIQENRGSKITGRIILEHNETKQFEIKNSTLFVAKQR